MVPFSSTYYGISLSFSRRFLSFETKAKRYLRPTEAITYYILLSHNTYHAHENLDETAGFMERIISPSQKITGRIFHNAMLA